MKLSATALAVTTAILAACGEAPATGPAEHDTRPWAENALSREDPGKLYVFITRGPFDAWSTCRLHWKWEDERFKNRQEECRAFVKTATAAFRNGGYDVTESDVGSIALWDWYLAKRDAIRECKQKQTTISGIAECDPENRM